MSVTYRNLLAFVRVAESATFAEAAEKMHLTQPALSSAIKKMESQLGGPLFSRSTRRVELTPEGLQLLPAAKRLLNDYDDVIDDMQSVFALQRGQLTLAAMPSFADSKLPALLYEFHKQHANIRLRVLDVVMESVIDAVITGKAELGFTFEPEISDGLYFEPLFEDRFIAIVNREHPLATLSQVDWSTCVAYPFVMMNRGSAVRKWTESTAAAYGKLTVIAETGQLNTLGQLVVSGLGMSVVPALCRQQMEKIGLHCLTLNGSHLTKHVGMIRSAHKPLSVAGNALWQMCVQAHLPLFLGRE